MSKQTNSFNPDLWRPQFPALQQEVNGQTAVYLDGPGGTQVPQGVISAMSTYLTQGGSNTGGPFVTSQRSDAIVEAARAAVADLLNAQPREIAFGQNMTSLTFSLSRALARRWQPGDEIIVTNLDHDANISPWLLAAEERGVTVRWLDFDPADCTLYLDQLPDLLNEKTRLLAITAASNAVGTIPDISKATKLAHAAGALVYVDAVHYTPHGPLDVKAIGCDFLACSAYKWFGPHTGILYGKYELLEELTAYKVRPAPTHTPGKWETGTQSFESLAGVTAAIDYLAQLGEGAARPDQLRSAMQRIKQYEQQISQRFLVGDNGRFWSQTIRHQRCRAAGRAHPHLCRQPGWLHPPAGGRPAWVSRASSSGVATITPSPSWSGWACWTRAAWFASALSITTRWLRWTGC
jgi:cysteine desulfurase family protein (TIGR01976 family)